MATTKDFSSSENEGFEWRGIYAYSNRTKEQCVQLNVSSPDYDWDLWGHNIRQVIGNDSTIARATVDGKKTSAQYCFSSDTLFFRLKRFVLRKGGKGRFTIMPKDNMIACQCEECKKIGNTPTNATPAVTKLINRLAKELPKAKFFTSAYNTTLTPPKEAMQKNVGVFISASNLQMRCQFQEKKGFKEFEGLLDTWLDKTKNIYIWDYCRNFDDYFTPFPCLEVLRSRLIYYKQKGVKGIFLNGSSPCYSTFDDIQTYALSRLMANPNSEIEPMVKEYLKAYYPETQKIISEYYLHLENKVKRSNNYLPMYADISEATEYYLQIGSFEQFRKDLEKASKGVDGEERKRLNLLLTALNFTRMELMRTKLKGYTRQEAEDALEVMKGALEVKEMQQYKEANGDLSEYIKRWEKEVLSSY
ncbi:MAG: DUF4838 domain-containing protein [Bacteroidaceae bacterium]|nr:DUF4838 domain-containing protein [Bacteroidaceae bacterium]